MKHTNDIPDGTVVGIRKSDGALIPIDWSLSRRQRFVRFVGRLTGIRKLARHAEPKPIGIMVGGKLMARGKVGYRIQ